MVHDLEVLETRTEAEDVTVVRIERPLGFEFVAGQYIILTLDTDEGPYRRPLSICSAEQDPYLEVATRISTSAFKRALALRGPGDRVHVAGPAGRLRLPVPVPPLTFLAGGIGITPIRSMVRTLMQADVTAEVDAVLFYGNRDERCVLFHDELHAYADRGLRVVEVFEDPIGAWTGETGLITSATITRYGGAPGRTCVVAGPPLMVAAMERLMDELGVPGEQRLVERFGSPSV